MKSRDYLVMFASELFLADTSCYRWNPLSRFEFSLLPPQKTNKQKPSEAKPLFIYCICVYPPLFLLLTRSVCLPTFSDLAAGLFLTDYERGPQKKIHHLIKAFRQIKTLWTGSSFLHIDFSEQKADYLSRQLSTLKVLVVLRLWQNLLKTSSS